VQRHDVMTGYVVPVGEPNRTIELASEKAILQFGRESVEALVRVLIPLLPKPRLVFEGEIPPCTPLDSVDRPTIRFVDLDLSVPCDVSKAALFSTQSSKARLWPRGNIVVGACDSPLRRVLFALPNFPQFIAKGMIKAVDGGWKREDEIELSFGSWNVMIRNTSDIKERKQFIAENGGYAITATGELSRCDGVEFTFSEADPWLEALRIFLSFVCGRWTGPLFSTGVNDSGEGVCQRWSVPLIDAGISVHTWFDPHHGMSLREAFSGFIKKWNNPVWKETISRAIYWFVRANSNAAGTDGSLILSQAALESLSWTYLVEDKGTLGPRQFKERGAANVIRVFLDRLHIPADVPNTLGDLQQEVVARCWRDGCGAVAAIRNNLVHPKKRGSLGPIFKCWVLAQWFLELSLLRLFGYHGKYGNRTVLRRWVGQVERVPWGDR